MTTVVYKKGVLAVDSLVSDVGGMLYPKPYSKLFIANGMAATMIGDLVHAKVLIDYILYECKTFQPGELLNLNGGFWPDKLTSTKSVTPDFNVVILTKKALFTIYGDGLLIESVKDDPYAIGSGAGYAMGALLAGASAVRAIEIAKILDPHTGYQVQHIKRSQL